MIKEGKIYWIGCALLFQVSNMFCQNNIAERANTLREILKPFFIPVDNSHPKENVALIELGRKLFYETKLSGSTKISCNSCHDLQKYGTNGSYYTALKAKNKFYRDVPSIYNTATYSLYNADGSVKTITKKIEESLLSVEELDGGDKLKIVAKIKALEGYKKAFKKAFPNKTIAISFTSITHVLEIFLMGLKTPAPFDEFIKGKNTVLSKTQIEGGFLFVEKSCYSCHTGSNVGGQMIQKLGIIYEWHNQQDLGFYKPSKKEAYKMFFRVAPLRNVEKTAPYFHDASFYQLDKAIELMGVHERGLKLSSEEINKIKQFLNSLTGVLPIHYIKNKN